MTAKLFQVEKLLKIQMVFRRSVLQGESVRSKMCCPAKTWNQKVTRPLQFLLLKRLQEEVLDLQLNPLKTCCRRNAISSNSILTREKAFGELNKSKEMQILKELENNITHIDGSLHCELESIMVIVAARLSVFIPKRKRATGKTLEATNQSGYYLVPPKVTNFKFLFIKHSRRERLT